MDERATSSCGRDDRQTAVRLADALGDKSYLDGDAFTAGDLMMTSVLRSLDGKDLILPRRSWPKSRPRSTVAF
jgi:glutathione S-transferase